MRGKQVDLSEFTNVPSPELLLRFHTCKSIKDDKKAEQIAKEFQRRDLILVNFSILGKPHENIPAPVVEMAGPKPKLRRVVKGCDHCFCMAEVSLFDGIEMKICCRCDKEVST